MSIPTKSFSYTIAPFVAIDITISTNKDSGEIFIHGHINPGSYQTHLRRKALKDLPNLYSDHELRMIGF